MTGRLSISEMSGLSGLSISTLHYYERAGLLLPVERGANGHRRYSERDVEWTQFIKRLRATGMPVATMREFAKLRQQGKVTLPKRAAMLEVHERTVRERIRELEQHLEAIHNKRERLQKGDKVRTKRLGSRPCSSKTQLFKLESVLTNFPCNAHQANTPSSPAWTRG
jgi:DNA-binding transcriptional MerR regulator